ncbi:ABC transporter ATP-binding protein/permease [Streptomyces sp. NBC_00047]|uniref:ATP-binding cassette domain-containing protein n=1 Tax=Streptomyces sp. NBC_00047 TaxID=2975627 RepID=UPI00225B3944|nr:ABC transporter ATP-binding protein [Streptomyces sp. NBC_00047]MCX5610051.1 ABC transporter ATP-binding protein/permease [Streptomyces sp. NBC_00047]
MSESEAWRRVAPEGRRFLRGRKGALGRLAAWSFLESAHTFLGGYGVARALDDGFLAGRTATGLAWLAAAGAGAVLGGFALRGVFAGLADLVEPLRDGLVRRSVRQALDRAVVDPARAPDAGAVSRLTQQTEMARDSFAGLVLTVRSFVFTAVGAFAGMAALAPVLLLIVLPPLLLGVAAFLATLRPMASVQRLSLDTDEALSDRVAALGEGLRDIVACGGQAAAEARVEPLIATQERLARRLARWAALRTLALGTAGRLPVIALLAATPWLLGHGITAGALAGGLMYVVQALLPALNSLMTALGSAGTRLLVVLERFCDPMPPAPDHGRATKPRGSVVHAGRRTAAAAELRGVTFAYGPGAAPVLDALDLVVRPGEHLAVVGPSGIGKSTLTALLAGMLSPDAGTVLVAGAAARREPGATGPDPRRTLLPQQAYVFTGTVRENLTHLSPGPGATGPGDADAQVRRAVSALGLEDLVERLGGLDAEVSPRLLSRGESQHLALAAAYLSTAPLLLLDEATCHLDPRTEERAERALAARPGTLVVVAHRVSSAARADRVLVLDGTRAVCGTHAELPARSALYRDLVGRWNGTSDE